MVRNLPILRCRRAIPLPKLLLVLRVDVEAKEVVGWLLQFKSDAPCLSVLSLGGDVVAAVGASGINFEKPWKKWQWSTS